MIRKIFKRWLYGFAGRFPYFDAVVYFPRHSHCFIEACKNGIFESGSTFILRALAKPGATFFEVGANIGLMAVPVLQGQADCRVVSFEPSPNVLPWLRRTIAESQYRDRWSLVPKAVGATSGQVTFNLSDRANNAFDGIRPTQRVATVRQEEVEMTTLDEVWHALGRPVVSHIKIDVEGGEMDVLAGGRECLAAQRPAVLLEWNRTNFIAYGHEPRTLLDFAAKSQFQIRAAPSLIPVHNLRDLELHMAFTENFLLLPEEQNA